MDDSSLNVVVFVVVVVVVVLVVVVVVVVVDVNVDVGAAVKGRHGINTSGAVAVPISPPFDSSPSQLLHQLKFFPFPSQLPRSATLEICRDIFNSIGSKRTKLDVKIKYER